MRVYEWLSKKAVDADYFVQLAPEEMGDLENVFPDAGSKCCLFEDAYYGFVDMNRKLFIPLKDPHLAFGGCFYDYPPYKKEPLAVDIDLTELSWQEDVANYP